MSQKGVPFLVFLLVVFVSVAWNATAQTPQDLYVRGMQAARRGEYPKALQDLGNWRARQDHDRQTHTDA